MTHPLLKRCQALGIRLEAGSDGLAIDAPAGSLTPDLVAEIRANKPALLAALKKPSGDGWPMANPTEDEEPGAPCPACGSLDRLWDLWGKASCQRCNAEKLERSRRLAGRAERLRQRARTESGPRTQQRAFSGPWEGDKLGKGLRRITAESGKAESFT